MQIMMLTIIFSCKYYSGNYFNDNQISINCLSFIHLNARSLNSNFKEIEDYLSSLNHKFDIIAISETWANESNEQTFTFHGYDAFHTVRKNKRGGGVALYVTQELACKLLYCKSFVVNDILECVTIEILLAGQKNVIVTCVYRSPDSNVDVFSEYIEQLFTDLSMRKSIFVCGDVNIDILKHESNIAAKSFLDTMYSMYSIDRPTRISNHSFSLIDNICTNVVNQTTLSGILLSDITDHLPIFVLCNYPTHIQRNSSRYVKKRIVNDLALASLSANLANEHWETVFRSVDVNRAYEEFMSIFPNFIILICPSKL